MPSGKNILYGRRPVEELLSSLSQEEIEKSIESVYISEGIQKDFRMILEDYIPRKLFRNLSRKELDKMHPGINHQGIILRLSKGFQPPGRASYAAWKDLFSETDGLIVLLDRIQDPHNAGNIIRTAEALGAKAVLLTGSGAKPGPTVDKTSAGATLHLPHFSVQNADQVIEKAKENGYWICVSSSDEDMALSVKKEQLHLYSDALENLPSADEIVLVIGHEGEGVKSLIRQKADYFITIPISGNTSSLNAGTASGILIDRIIHR